MAWKIIEIGLARAMLGLGCLGSVATVVWVVERELRRRARLRRDREWYRAPPKRLPNPKKWLN
jgi:uncharacterized membrane protein